MKRRESASSRKDRGIEMEDQGDSVQKLKDAAKTSESVKFSDKDPVKLSKPSIGTRILKAIWRTRWTDDFSEDRESYVRTTLRELAIYIIFIILLVIITLFMTSSDTYYFTKVMQDLFQTKKWEDIGSEEDFWKYINADDDGLMSGLYWPEKYNGDQLDPEDQGYIYYENKLLGSPRIRQVRVRKNSCKVHERFKDAIDACYAPWSKDQEETEPLTLKDGKTFWMNHSTSEQLESRETYGKLFSSFSDPYSGGGYYVDLPRIDKTEAKKELTKLKNELWIGRGTRAVMIDFTVYNANVNLFCIIKLLFEFPASGGCFPHSNYQTLKLIRYVTPTDKFVQICEYIYIVFILYYIIEEAIEIHKHKVKYFYKMHNILDCLVILLSIVGIGFNIYRTIHVDSLLDDVLKKSNNSTVEDQYANFEMIGFWQTRYNDMAAIIVFVAWFKIFKYISFNKTMTQLSETLEKCAKDIMGFLVMFLIVFAAFMQWGFLLFGTQVKDFSTMMDSFFTLFRIILGDFDFEAIENANRILGPIYFLFFVFFVFFVLLNMFLAIINDTYGAVKDELAERKNEFEVSDYFKKGYQKMKDKLSFKREKIVDIQEALEVADANQDEGISFDEMKVQLRERGHTDDEIETLFSKYDVDSNRILTKEEQERMKADLKEEKADVDEDIAAVDKAEETRAAADVARAEMDEDSDGDDVRRALRVRGNVGNVALGGVAYEEFTVLSRRVDRVEHSIGTIVHKVDSVLLKLEMLDKGKSKRRETITKLLSTVSEEDKEILLGKDKKRTIEEITRDDYNETGGSRSSLRSGHGSPNNVTYRGTGSNQQV